MGLLQAASTMFCWNFLKSVDDYSLYFDIRLVFISLGIYNDYEFVALLLFAANLMALVTLLIVLLRVNTIYM